MRKLICIQCGKRYYTEDMTTPVTKIPPCENCGGNLIEFNNSSEDE